MLGSPVLDAGAALAASADAASVADRYDATDRYDAAEPDALLQAAAAALALIRDEAGHPAFVADRALLGALHAGRLPSPDDEVELGFLAPSPYPVDVARASYRLERLFRRAGWATWRLSAGEFKVAGEGAPALEVVAGWYADGWFHLLGGLRVPAAYAKLLPLAELEIGLHRLPVPADPTWLLEAAFWSDPATPDRSSDDAPTRRTTRRIHSWMRGADANRDHWLTFYRGPADAVSGTPSPFAAWFAGRERPGGRVVDIGCGTGRDALWLAEQGFDVLGLDYAPGAVRRARQGACVRKVGAQFSTFNLYDARHALALGGLLSHEPEPVTLYGRFLLHAINESGRRNLWLLARSCLRRGGRFYLEFRAADDAAEPADLVFGEHFRTLLRHADVAAEIDASGGRVEHCELGRGLAVYQHEDPYICRMVATWPQKGADETVRTKP